MRTLFGVGMFSLNGLEDVRRTREALSICYTRSCVQHLVDAESRSVRAVAVETALSPAIS